MNVLQHEPHISGQPAEGVLHQLKSNNLCVGPAPVSVSLEVTQINLQCVQVLRVSSRLSSS